MILAPDHQPLRDDAQPAHMDVQGKGLYTLGFKQYCSKRNDRRVGSAQQFLHAFT